MTVDWMNRIPQRYFLGSQPHLSHSRFHLGQAPQPHPFSHIEFLTRSIHHGRAVGITDVRFLPRVPSSFIHFLPPILWFFLSPALISLPLPWANPPWPFVSIFGVSLFISAFLRPFGSLFLLILLYWMDEVKAASIYHHKHKTIWLMKHKVAQRGPHIPWTLWVSFRTGQHVYLSLWVPQTHPCSNRD